MKKLFFIMMVIVIGLSFTTPAQATDIPGGPFTSKFSVQNLGTETANVSYSFYDAAGTVAFTASSTIAVNDTLHVLVSSIGGLAAGEYALTISSSQPVAAVTSFGDSNSIAAYSGFASGATEWFVPGLYDNYYEYYSEVYVQNTTSSAIDVTLNLYAPGSSTPVYTNTKTSIPANASATWSQKDMTELATNVAYSGKVTSTGNVVVVANIFGSASTEMQLYSYNAYPGGGVKWFTPVLMKGYYNWNAAVVIQNISSTVANATITYSTGFSQDWVIQPYSAQTIYIPGQIELPSGTAGLFSAIVTSDVDVVVMVNESNNYQRAATYNGLLTGTATVAAPTVTKKAADYSTSVTCQNLGDAATTLTIDFTGQPTASQTSTSVAPGAQYLWYLPNLVELPDGYDGSAIITSNAGEEIACIINMNMEFAPYNTTSMDQLSSYNGIN